MKIAPSQKVDVDATQNVPQKDPRPPLSPGRGRLAAAAVATRTAAPSPHRRRTVTRNCAAGMGE